VSALADLSGACQSALVRTSAEVRERLLQRLSFSITRPEMMTTSSDLDGYFQVLLGDLAFIDETGDEVQPAVQAIIKDRGLWGSTGTLHRVSELVPARVAVKVRASIWAEVGFKLGWVAVDPAHVRSPQAFEAAVTNLHNAIDRDLAGRDLRGLIGDPSILDRYRRPRWPMVPRRSRPLARAERGPFARSVRGHR